MPLSQTAHTPSVESGAVKTSRCLTSHPQLPAASLTAPAEDTAFKYKKLNKDSHQIRLLRLSRASEGAVEGETIVRDLGLQDSTPYDAVSYAWGDPNLCETVIVDEQVMPVTRNAFEMLCSLGRAKHQSYLWIDAICINQRDVAERNHQVQQMREIYSAARKVVIHLGGPTADTDLLMGTIVELTENQSSTGPGPRDPEGEWAAVQARLRRDMGADAEQRQRNAMRDLLGRPYFERVWIIQEIMLPQQGVVQCGDWVVTCESFVAVAQHLRVCPGAYRTQLLLAMPTLLRKVTLHDDDQDLYSLLLRYREAKASDERDRIYALSSLAHPIEREPLEVDYAQTEAELVRRTIAHICKCDLECLPVEDPAPTIASFLADLDTLHQRVLGQILRSTHALTPFFVSILIEDPYRVFNITTMMLQDAHANPVHAEALMTQLIQYRPGNEQPRARRRGPWVMESQFFRSNSSKSRWRGHVHTFTAKL
ncbi:heterokaryon incompatibility protein-domain-containing protein [Microdochium bolleyi]|uniref:Heterokaryon incompatibility protein-domain-containing protein n=1 Tax=Microdochium bolleyi TaxID=196109 RepID=A0A136JAI9_9PEZI|nr:heterokaryon incompatibility protein-domain-containing protein [Microdochium bolleyi]